jgi:uncharacterized repeat protein (TIGR04138 family)
MTEESDKTIKDLVRDTGRYPEEAFHFVREGLGYAAEQAHGPETEAHRQLYHFLASQKMDWSDLVSGYYAGGLPGPVMQAIEAAGGCEKLDRHVSGRQLCWALRDFAVRRWGMLAQTVLESWNITCTDDFGRIVYAFIDSDLMQKQPEDRFEDFESVYAFDEAFEQALPDERDSGHPDDTDI